jgi:hypothetical protein
MSFGDFFVDGILMACLMVFAFYKIFGTIDHDGEIKKTANKGIATWLDKLFQKK